MRKLTIIITDELDTMYDVELVRSRELFIDDSMTDSEIAAFAKKHAEDISLQNNRAIANYLGVSEDINADKNNGFAVTTPNFEYTVDSTDEYDSIIDYSPYGYYEVAKSGKKGLLNLRHKVFIPCTMDMISGPCNGVFYFEQDGKFGVYHIDSDTLIDAKFDNIWDDGFESLVQVTYKGEDGYVTYNGDFVSNEQYDNGENEDSLIVAGWQW